jgi:hypothetical protein
MCKGSLKNLLTCKSPSPNTTSFVFAGSLQIKLRKRKTEVKGPGESTEEQSQKMVKGDPRKKAVCHPSIAAIPACMQSEVSGRYFFR